MFEQEHAEEDDETLHVLGGLVVGQPPEENREDLSPQGVHGLGGHVQQQSLQQVEALGNKEIVLLSEQTCA